MTLQEFFLVCFFSGFLLSVVSFLGSGLHFHLHSHVHVHHGGPKGGTGRLNFGTATSFVMWFGGTGYLLLRYWPTSWIWIVAAATGAGMIGASIIFWWVAKFLAQNERNLDPADYEMRGVLGKISSSVRPGGIGEMIFSQQGTRRAFPVRGEDGQEFPRGTEVIVTRVEKGVAYVRRWEES